jgi:dienelactone hydrolase
VSGRSISALAIAALLAAGAFAASDYVRGAALVIDAARIGGWMSRASTWTARAHTRSSLKVPWRGGSLAAYAYVPDGEIHRGLLVVPGVHAVGIDESRLVHFAGDLAARGYAVLTVELPDLKAYAMTPRSTDMIEDAALWLASRGDLAPEGRVGLIGISFGGGLSLVAAGRPQLRDRVSMALSFGGHGDLPRTLGYLCTGRLPDGGYLPPHDYGVVLILLGVAERVAPAGQVEALKRGIRVFLEASHVDMVDKRRAATLFARARELQQEMPEPAATLMGYVNQRNVKALGPLLRPHVAALSGDPALSPERSPAPSAPVFLLHGMDDNVIPAAESVLLSRHLADATRVRLLLTPLITHAEVEPPRDVGAIWELVSFWTDVLDE